MAISTGKYTKLVGGCKAVIFAIADEGKKPIQGTYFNGMEWIPCSWKRSGRYRLDSKKCGLDLIMNTEDDVA